MMILTVTENKALLSSDSIFLENTFLELWRGFLFFNRNFNIRASIGILALKVYFLSRNRTRRFLFRFSFNRQIVNETHYVIIDSPLAREKKTSSACLKSSGLHDIFRWYTQWEIFNRSALNLVEEKRIKKQMQCWRNIWDWKVNH